MRILWFTNTPSGYKKDKLTDTKNSGGGWISSLEEILVKDYKIKLGICFFSNEDKSKIELNNTIYYPISLYNSFFKKIKHLLYYKKYDMLEIYEFLKVVEDFKPDIIHIFGSENSFGLLSYHISTPIVIHIQGIINPYLNAWFPPGINSFSYIKYSSFSKSVINFKNLLFFTHSAEREEKILSNCKNFMGRTEWDKSIVSLYSPTSNYFYCNEILRKKFYLANEWLMPKTEKIEIITTIAQNSYKGLDLIFKTAKLLSKFSKYNYRWRIYGITSIRFWEKIFKIKGISVNIFEMGIVNEDKLIEAIQNSSIYVHPSYIDNSPNSLCEAQLLGIPVIATNVGGISSLIKDNVNGILVPANDPFVLCNKILELFSNKKMAKNLGANGRLTAISRHNVEVIKDTNIYVYNELLKIQDVNSSNL